jgi:hypothetical protein
MEGPPATPNPLVMPISLFWPQWHQMADRVSTEATWTSALWLRKENIPYGDKRTPDQHRAFLSETHAGGTLIISGCRDHDLSCRVRPFAPGFWLPYLRTQSGQNDLAEQKGE